MKTVKLNTSERLIAIGICNSENSKISVERLKDFHENASKFGLSEEEKTAVHWIENKDEEGKVISFSWEDKDVEPKDIEISDFMHKFFVDKFPSLEYSPTDPLAYAAVTFMEKVKAV